MRSFQNSSGLSSNIQTTNCHTLRHTSKRKRKNSTNSFMKTKNCLRTINNSKLRKWTKRRISWINMKAKNNTKRTKFLKTSSRKKKMWSMSFVRVYCKRKDLKSSSNCAHKTRPKTKSIWPLWTIYYKT